MKIKDLKKEINGVFKMPVKKYYFGKLYFGTPYMYPINFNSTIIKIYKQKPKYLRNRYFKLFNYTISYGWPIYISKIELGWKDKYQTPRYEFSPAFQINFFNYQFCIFYNAPDDVKINDVDTYYEMILWYLYYSDKDIKKAKETWQWIDYDTKKSTWNDKFLNKKGDY